LPFLKSERVGNSAPGGLLLTVNAWDRIIVEIDPDKKIDDLTRHNNRVDYDFKGSLDRFKGWR
jgi:hypothetical protein